MHITKIITKNLFVIVTLIACFAPGNVVRADDCPEAQKWYNEGMALSDDSEREASYYQRAIELCPEFFEAHNRLGEVYKSWGQYELAIKEFEQASRNWLFAEPHNNLGEIYTSQGRYDLAEQEFTKAIRIRPDFREAQNNLKYVHKRLGRYDLAVEAPPDPMPVAPLSRVSGTALPKGTFLVDFQYKYWRQNADVESMVVVVDVPAAYGPVSRQLDVQAFIWGIRYGATDDLTIGLIPKYFRKTAHMTVSYWGVDAEPEVSGFGDVVFLTKYHLYGRRRTHFSVSHLLNIPTGDEDAVGEDGSIVRRIPLGSGGFDFGPGMALTTTLGPLTVHAGVWYVITTRNLTGDEFHFDVAAVLPEFRGFVPGMELNYRWSGPSSRQQFYQTSFGFQPASPWAIPGPFTSETIVEDPGGYTLFVSPSLQIYVTKTLRAELGIQVPLIEPEGGWTEEAVFHLGLVRYIHMYGL